MMQAPMDQNESYYSSSIAMLRCLGKMAKTALYLHWHAKKSLVQVAGEFGLQDPYTPGKWRSRCHA